MKKLLAAIVILAILLTTGCSLLATDSAPNSDQKAQESQLPADKNETPGQEEEAEEELNSLAGIQLGASSKEVIEQLGDQYKEEKFEDDAFFGEGFARWQYEGLDVVIGLESQKVLQVDVYAPQFSTNLGDEVGDNANAVLEKYRSRYNEYEGVNSDGKLTGWFQTDENTLVIFSFNEDLSRFNEEVTEDSKVEGITLGYTYYFH